MATSGEKTEGNQNACCDFTDYVVKLEKARKVTLFLNGDKNFFGAQMLVNTRHFRTWDAFLNASTEKTGVNSAVRYITTPVTGTRLDGLDDLQDKESYVAITRGQFKPIGYTTLFDRHKQYLASNVHRTSSILKIRPVEHSRIQVPGKIAQVPIHAIMINVYLNGRDFDAPFRIALNQRVLRKWGLVMREIAEHVNGITGRPRALYTVDGSKVITNSADLEPGGMYVIVGSEPGGFQHYCYGCQTRAKHPKKLPPIKRKRRRPKKIAEKEISSFDVPPPAQVEAFNGDQEIQQGNTEMAPVDTSQGDFPVYTTFKQPDDAELPIVEPTLGRHSSHTPKSKTSIERRSSLQIEKVSSSAIKDLEKTQSAPSIPAEEQLNYASPTQMTGKEFVEDSQVTEKLTNVIEQSYPLQSTDTEEETEQEVEEETEQEVEEETEQEVEEETEQKVEEETEQEVEEETEQEMEEKTEHEEEAERMGEIEKEMEMVEEKNDALFDQDVASFEKAGPILDLQQNSEKDELNHIDKKSSERSSVRQFHTEDLSAANSEVVGPSLQTGEVESDVQLDQGDKAKSKTDIDVEEETKDHNEHDSTPVALDTNDSDAAERVEQYAQAANQSDETITKNIDEPEVNRGSNEILDDEKTENDNINEFSFDDRRRSETNADVKEEMKDHSERDSILAATDTNNSDDKDQVKRLSSDEPVHAEVSKTSDSLSPSEVPVAKDPSESHSTRSSKTGIQPHR